MSALLCRAAIPDGNGLGARVHLLGAVGGPSVAFVEGGGALVLLEGPEDDLGVTQVGDPPEGRPHQGVSRPLAPASGIDVDRGELGDVTAEVAVAGRRGHVAVAREV